MDFNCTFDCSHDALHDFRYAGPVFSGRHCDPSNPDFLGSKRVYFCQQQHLVNIPWRQLCCDSDVSAYGEHFRKNRHSGRSV